MARRRYQHPKPKRVGRRWEIVIRQDVVGADGKISRKQFRVTLGYVDQIKTAKQAARVAEPILARVNTNLPRFVIGFSELAARYMNVILPEKKPSTRAAYTSHLKKWIIPEFGDRSVHDITVESVQSFIAKLRGVLGAGSEKTVWNIVTTLRDVWGTARSWGYVQDDVFSRIQLRKPRPEQSRFFTLDEVRRIIAYAEEPFRTLYHMAAETGMRAGELCALRWEDVDLESGIVVARRSVWHGKFTDTKNGRERRFAISAHLSGALKALRESEEGGSGLIFHTSSGGPFSGDDVVKKNLGPLLERLGIPHGGMHAFRHFNGSAMLSLGAPAQTARDRLGHSSIAVTNIYSHGVSDDDRAVASRLGDALRIWWNTSKQDEDVRMDSLLESVIDGQLTYKALIA